MSGVNTLLISPRRWGKSSLVERVLEDISIEKEQVAIISLDMFSVSSEAEFLNVFAREVIKATSTKWEDWVNTVKQVFKQIVPKVSLGVDPNNEFSLSFDFGELLKHRSEILSLPEEIAKQKKIKMVVCLDEFQSIASFEHYEQLEKAMRAAWQRHKLVSYCLYGSKRHIMENIFNNASKPFYRFGDII